MAGVGHEVCEEIKFSGCEADFFATFFDGAAGRLQLKDADVDGGFRRVARGVLAADGSADSGGELSYLERLDDVVVGAGVKGLHGVVFGIADGDNEDGDVRILMADAATSLHTTHAGHVEVHEDCVVWSGVEEAEGVFTRAGFTDAETEGREGGAEPMADGRVVFYDEHGALQVIHCVWPFLRAAR